MSFFDDVSSFFGYGDKQEGPISVPLPYDSNTGANDPAVQAAQAKFSAACQREDELKARETSERQLAEGRQSEDWMQKAKQAQTEHDSLKNQYENARTKAQGGDLYDDQKQELYRRFTAAYQKLKAVENLHVFAQSNPVSKYMDPAYQQQLKEAGLARMQAQNELDAAKRAVARSR
jgi:hypothetical protein